MLVGVTKVGSVQGYLLQDGQRVPTPGRLYYRGIELNDIVEAHRKADTFGFEEVAYLLLMGYLPTQDELARFNGIMSSGAQAAGRLYRGHDHASPQQQHDELSGCAAC